MLRPRFVDLHVHTVLSPCAEVEMIPPLIIRQARRLWLDVIAITDHNSAENVAAVMKAAQGSGITVMPGMEVQTREEIHLVCLFDTLDQVQRWQELVYAHLPDQRNREDVFGAQFVVDETGEFIRYNKRLLLTSTSMSLEQVTEYVRALGGLCIAAHIDRPGYSILTALGFIPPELDLDAIEMSAQTTPVEVRRRFPGLSSYAMIISGDSHRLSEMIAKTVLVIDEPCIKELRLAMSKAGGRSIKVID